MLHADFISFPVAQNYFPNSPSWCFLYILLYDSYFSVCLRIPITFLFHWIIQNFEQSFHKLINVLPMCLVNKRMSDWLVDEYFLLWLWSNAKFLSIKLKYRRKRQKVKEHDECDLCPLAHKVVWLSVKKIWNRITPRFSRYRCQEMDGLHQHLSWSDRPCHTGQVIVTFQLNSSNVLFLRKIQRTPKQSEWWIL